MQRRKSFFNNEMEQRFSLRKYTIGLCSVCLGFITIGMGSQTVKADTVNNVEKSSVMQENRKQDADSANTVASTEAKANTPDSATAKPNITPTETKENETGSVATTAPKTNIASNGAKANSTVASSTIVSDQAKSTKAKLVVQPKVRVASKEVKPNTAVSATLAETKLAKPVDAKVLDEAQVATDNQFNFDDWTTQIDDTYLNITGYKGDRSNQIVVPNGADFAKAGKNDKNLQVEIDQNTLADLIVDGVAPKLSNTDGQKIVAKGSYWSMAFWQKDLHDISGLANLDTSNVTDMSEMFYNNQISDLSPLANWNTGNVTDMSEMFYNNQISDLSPLANWNTGKVTYMSEMFYNNQISDLSPLANWNTGKVTNMSNMFFDNRISDLSPLANWNTGNVTNMSSIFGNSLYGKNQISDLSPLANWNTGKVTDMSDMFAGNQISDLSPLANWNTGNVTNMSSIFSNNQISDLSPLANWNTGNVNDMNYMFDSNQISDLSPLANWNTGNVTYMLYMFGNNQISDLSPLAGWNTGNVTNMGIMFCNNRINDLSPLASWNTGNVTDMSVMFAGNQISDLSPLAGWNTGKVIDMNNMFDENQISDLSPLAGWNTGKVTNMRKMFSDNRIRDLSPLANWNTGKVTDMNNMFHNNQISDLSSLANWNTGNVIYMSNMFDNNQISDLSPLANWNTGKVTDMSNMFHNNRINDLSPLANWNTGNVIYMNNMFDNNRISDLSPLADWNTGKVTDMNNMFNNNRISDLSPLANWNTGNVTNMSYMFASNQISDLSPLAGWNTGNVTNMSEMFYYDPLNSTINSQSTLNKFHAIAYKLDNIRTLDSRSESKTFNDSSQILLDKNVVTKLDKNVVTKGDSATLTFKANSSAGNTYQIKIYNPNGSINIQAAPLPTALGTTDKSYQDGYTIITNKFINNGSVSQDISIVQDHDKPAFAQYESTSGLITVVKDNEDLGSINITYQNGSDINNHISTPYIVNKPYINHTQNTFYFQPQIDPNSVVKSAGLTITVPDDVTIDPDTFIDNATGKTLKATKIADNQYQVVLNDTTDGIAVKGLINVPADKLTNGTVHLPGFGMKYTINTYNDKVAPLVATGTSKELSIIPDLASYHGNLININQSKWAFNRNGNKVFNYTSQGFTNEFNGIPLEPAVSTQVTNGVETFDMPTGVSITNFDPKFNIDVINHIDYIYTDGSKQITSSFSKIPKAIRQMKVYFKNGIQSYELVDGNSNFALSFDATYPDGTPIKNFDTFKITGSFSCDELGSTDNVDVAQIMLAPTQKLTDGMLTDTSQDESNKAPNANGNSISATIRNDVLQHQGHLTNPIFYFKYNDLMVPDLSEISASYDNQNKELGSIGLTNIDNNKIHSSIITDSTGQKFIKVQVDGEYYYGGSSDRKSDFNVKIPIINAPDALTATKDWSWYILNNSDEAKTESAIRNSSQSNKLSSATVDGNTLSVGGTGTWQIIVAQGFTSSTETQGNLNGGPGLASTQDDHQQDPTHFYIYDSIINATNDAKSDLVSVANLPSTKDGKSQFDVHMTGKASLINVMTGQTYDATITYSYGTGDNNFITGDQVTDWSKVKLIKVVPNGGAPSMTGLRLVVPVEDKTVYDDVGKTIYVSTMTYGEDKTNTNYTTKDGFAVPEKSTIPPNIIKAGDMASAKLTVQGQATVHTLIHYKDANGKDVYVKLADQDKTYNELQDTMKRSDYLQSDSDLTIADRGLLPTGMIINYNHPTIHNSNNTYAADYANNVAAFDKMAKYDFDGDQVIFEGAMPEIVTKTHQAKETIHYIYSDGRTAAPDKVLTSITLKQTGSKNPFTGEITWNTPATDTLNSVNSPEITGYIADNLTVPSYVVTMTSPDKEVTVTYDADNENADFTYFDDTANSTLKVIKKSGKSNASIGYTTTDDINNYEKQGYTLVSDETNGRNLNFDSLPTIDQHYTIHLKHKTENVTRNDTVTRTIHYLYDNGNTAQPDKTQTVSFDETGTKDDITGETTWNNDSAQTVDSVNTPSIVGYTPDKSSIEKQTFKFGDKDVEVTVTYSANAQTATITYIDDTKKETLGSDKQNGKFDHKIIFEHDPAKVIKGLEEKGYKLVSNDFNSNKYQADNSNNVFYVHLKHGTSESSRKDDVNMTVHYVMDDGSKAPSDSKQTVSFTENGIKDNVTGNITWMPATSQTLKDVDSPVLTGYTADIKTANGEAVNFGDPDINVTVHYSANAQTATITYIDDTENKTLGSDKQNGKFNQVITFEHDPAEVIKGLEEKGYKLVSNDFNSNKYQADNSNNVFYVHLKHGTTTVTPDNPGHPGEPVDPKNSEGPKYPNGTELDQVKRTGTQTIHYVGAGDKTPADNKQTFEFTREITFDNVTGKIIKVTSWNVESHTFGNVDTPVIPGYHADKAVAGGATVTPDDLNKVIIVTYAPDGGSGDNPGSNGGGDQGTTPTPEPVPEPTPSPDDQPDTTLPSDNNTDKDVEKDKQDKPEEVKKARKIIKTRITKQEHIGNAEKAEPIAEQEHNDQTVASPVKNEDNEHQLPQTGEANTSVIGLLGMLVAGFAAILGFESSRSRKHKN